MHLAGIHHLTAVTANAPGNLAFYTQVMGMRLVKKTVNQDDTSSYHLFYADRRGNPGTDLTFFDWPAVRERRGGRSIVRTGLRVPGEASLGWWADRLSAHNILRGEVAERGGLLSLDLEDPEGHRLSLIADEAASAATAGWEAWEGSPVPAEHQVRGLGPITISVPALDPTAEVLTGLMQMRPGRQYTSEGTDGDPRRTVEVQVFEMGAVRGPADLLMPSAELHVAVEPELGPARLGAGGVHHVAFRIPTFEEYDQWAQRLVEHGVRTSGPVDRFWFRSLYFRELAGILFELATDGPGFTADEPLESLGERLVLPPFLEDRRKLIEARLKPL